MATETDKDLKLYYSIKEVSALVGVSESTLRFWETQFGQLRPKTTRAGVRQYTKADIELVRTIHSLVHKRGLKIAAARALIAEGGHKRGAADSQAKLLERLAGLKESLMALKKQLDYLE